ncbi:MULTISPECIES: AI-2E family transporter [unclassified Amycolatopsis]|uniref:AI-2E family transporter n=1 Tax=unclassified Amycolatopsis TaxID=2618356 RepID=UPI002E0F5804|nr:MULTISPECIES: AI-2E family transporter [unclassified Amycolatopsis]WSJ80481.1 AI-2E family transporter [Amycolatopsis sp. NBC_01307]WSK76039.1 AI-2E family transporter [Amycolatopsis sp. NBC_01286]
MPEPEDRLPDEAPHDGGSFADAEAAAAELSTTAQPLGATGEPLNRRSPFLIGMAGAAGVAVIYALVQIIAGLQDVLVLIGLALFLAIGLEPAVAWLTRHRFPRWLAVTTVFVVGLLAIGGFLTAAIPVLVEQATQFVTKAPGYLHDAQNHNTALGQLNERFHLQQQLESLVSGPGIGSGLLGAGQAVFSALTNVLLLVVLTVYFLVDLPRIRAGGYRLIPHSRRPRAILIGDEIFTKVGGYVLGNLAISVIAGVLTLVWLLIFGVPYAALLAIAVAILDLIPVVGSVVGGVLVSLVALTVSLPVCLGTIGFFIGYRLVEDYVLVPRIIGGAVKVPALITVVAVILGGALLGVVGALVAIPVAAALLLLVREVLYPRLDRT